MLNRLPENPILQPRAENAWESSAVFNTAALYLDGRVHLLYRAIGHAGVSVLGYASSRDGVHIDERLNEPVYVSYPLLDDAQTPYVPVSYASGASYCGCEDPRLVQIEDTIYMLYTAFDGIHHPAVALTCISVADFLNKKWCWRQPVMLSKMGESHKNWTLFPEKIGANYALLHSISPEILIEYLDSFEFDSDDHVHSYYRPAWREGYWDNWIRGVGAPPIKTAEGWLVLYHAMDMRDPNRYKIGAKMLSLDDPTKVLYRIDDPILAPDATYENDGLKAGVVYTCGAVIVGDDLLVYYGGADTVICVASVNIHTFLQYLKTCAEPPPRAELAQRVIENPILQPIPTHPWENMGAFNPCIVKTGNQYHLLYRALSFAPEQSPAYQHVSSIAYAVGTDTTHFKERRSFIVPEYEWEKFGCEDPRVTYLNDRYYIFYTALSKYPFVPEGIHIGLAITRDFKTVDAKYQITHFNSKAMALFPDRIGGKMAAILTVHTDLPPAKIAIAWFDHDDDLFSEDYWTQWYANLPAHVIPLLEGTHDHVEVGAAPIKTTQGWLLVYSHIYQYFSEQKIFSVQAVLLDLHHPQKVLGKTRFSLFSPEKKYEMEGYLPQIVFPSSALLEGDDLSIYYGAADTCSCVAVVKLSTLLAEMTTHEPAAFIPARAAHGGFQRWNQNPILSPRPEFAWEARSVFNPAAIYEDGKVHLLYRAMSWDDTSVFGYASSRDGVTIDERLTMPVYTPQEEYEHKKRPGNSGCEDPRITRVGDRFFVFYTAFDGYAARVAFTSIKVTDFLQHRWNWFPSKVITSDQVSDKDACLFPEKINGKYIILNRPGDLSAICINFLDDLEFKNHYFLNGLQPLIRPENHTPPVKKVGISTPPLKTEWGWLLFYHWVTFDSVYQVGATLLDLQDPSRVLGQLGTMLLQPEMDYERQGDVNNVVFPCGGVLIDEDVFLYYGGGDKVIGVCKMPLLDIINIILQTPSVNRLQYIAQQVSIQS